MDNVSRGLSSFLDEEFNSGLMFIGDWGIGKTYYVLNKIKELAHHKYDSISYISLFRIKDIKVIEENINNNIKYINSDGLPNLIKDRLSIDKKLKIKGITIDISNFIQNRLNKTIIVLDDFERKDSSLQDEDIVALMNRITQNFNSKFIIISNSKEFNDNNIPSLPYYEKIFSKVIKFKRSESSSLEIAKEMYTKGNLGKKIFLNTKDINNTLCLSDNDFISKFEKKIKELKINNIRIIYNMLHLCTSYELIIKHLNIKDINKEIIDILEDYFFCMSLAHTYGLINVFLSDTYYTLGMVENKLSNLKNDKNDKNDKKLYSTMANNSSFIKETLKKSSIYLVDSYISPSYKEIINNLIKIILNNDIDNFQDIKKSFIIYINEAIKYLNDESINQTINIILNTTKKVKIEDEKKLFNSRSYIIPLNLIPKLVKIYSSRKEFDGFFIQQIKSNFKKIENSFKNNKSEDIHYYNYTVKNTNKVIHSFLNEIKDEKIVKNNEEFYKFLISFKVEEKPARKSLSEQKELLSDLVGTLLMPLVEPNGNKWNYVFDNGDFLFSKKEKKMYLSQFHDFEQYKSLMYSFCCDYFFEHEQNKNFLVEYYKIYKSKNNLSLEELVYNEHENYLKEDLNVNDYDYEKINFHLTNTLNSFKSFIDSYMDKIFKENDTLEERVKLIYFS